MTLQLMRVRTGLPLELLMSVKGTCCSPKSGLASCLYSLFGSKEVDTEIFIFFCT